MLLLSRHFNSAPPYIRVSTWNIKVAITYQGHQRIQTSNAFQCHFPRGVGTTKRAKQDAKPIGLTFFQPFVNGFQSCFPRLHFPWVVPFKSFLFGIEQPRTGDGAIVGHFHLPGIFVFSKIFDFVAWYVQFSRRLL